MNVAEQSAGAAPGGNGWFNTTHWSVVLLAGKDQTPQGVAALEHLCRTYWHPLYVFILRQGYSPEDAQDLTQQFFARLLERNDFGEVDPHKGRFRTFLLTSLTHFLSNERDRVQAAKRGGGRKIISLDEIQASEFYRFEPTSELSPDKLFDQRWAMVVLEQALRHLREELAAGGKAAQFEELKSYLTEEPGEGEYAKVAARIGQTPQAVAVTVYRLRQRYRELVRAEVAQTVSSPLELEQEMRHLLDALNL